MFGANFFIGQKKPLLYSFGLIDNFANHNMFFPQPQS